MDGQREKSICSLLERNDRRAEMVPVGNHSKLLIGLESMTSQVSLTNRALYFEGLLKWN